MDNLEKYHVMMKIEAGGPAKDDPEIEKTVMASSPTDARKKALDLVKLENPEVNYTAIWFETTQRRYY